MYAQMCFEITFESKGFFAHWVRANEFFLSLMLFEMKLELRLTCKALTAVINGTCVRFNFHMSLLVIFKMTLRQEGFSTAWLMAFE